METRRRSSGSWLGAWLLLAAVATAAASTSATVAPAAAVAATRAYWPTWYEWPVVAAAANARPAVDRPLGGRAAHEPRRRSLYRRSRPSPFSAGWKKRYDDRNGPRRPFAGDEQRARYAFSSWGGKRSPPAQAPVDERVAWDARRRPSFYSGGGGGGGGGKRSQRFFSWGGKRSLTDDELRRMATATKAVAPDVVGHQSARQRLE